MQNINFETIDATMLAAVAGGGFNWGSFSNDVRKGIITGTVGGAVGGGSSVRRRRAGRAWCRGRSPVGSAAAWAAA